MEEIRKEIPWCPKGKYFVSNLGRVKNNKEYIFKGDANWFGYKRVELVRGPGDKKKYLVHRLVYTIFNGLPYNYGSKTNGLVCHKDNNPGNNKLSNLYIGTQKENLKQCSNDGRKYIPRFYGENNPLSKFKEVAIKEAIRMYNAGFKQKTIGRLLGISLTNINSIVKGKTWKHLPREGIID